MAAFAVAALCAVRGRSGQYRFPLAEVAPANLVIRGGNLNNGANDGPFYLNLNNGFSNSNWNYGSRLKQCYLEPPSRYLDA